jgi:signal transduction histidine kinase
MQGKTPLLLLGDDTHAGAAVGPLVAPAAATVNAPVASMTAYRKETELLTAERTPQAAGLFLCLIAGAGLFEYHYDPERIAVFIAAYAIQAFLCLALLVVRRPLRRRGRLLPAAIALWSLLGVSLNAYSLAAAVQPELTALANVMFATAISMMMPWGTQGQLIVSSAGLLAYGSFLLARQPVAVPGPYLLFAVAGGAALSIIGARSLDLHRFAIFRESTDREEEAGVNRMLLAIGTTMNSSLDAGDVLDRIAAAVRQALDFDWAVILLWDERRGAFRIAGGASNAPEAMDAARALDIPLETSPLIRSVLDTSYVEISGHELSGALDAVTARFLERYRIEGLSAASLVRGGQVVGILAAGTHKRPLHHMPGLRTLFGGIAQHAAIALDNVRLVSNLRQADQLKSEFVSTISHELRTPMNVILGYSELFLDDAFGPLSPQQSHTMRRLRESARSLLDLINAILEVNRLEAGRSPIERDDFPLDDLLAEIRRDCEDMPRSRPVQLLWETKCDGARVRTDRRKLKIVLKNVIGNALKFTADGQVSVHSRYWRERDSLEVRVVDTGPGIDETELPEIFGMFRQAEGGQLRGGVGLGLYIVKRFVDQLGGRIQVSSQLGKGSVFTITVPADPAADEVAEARLAG